MSNADDQDLIRAQRDVNEKLVLATLKAREDAEASAGQVIDLRKSEGELRAMAELREEFLGVVSHDLRNPLWTIQMASHLLLKRDDDAQAVHRLASRIMDSAKRMERMIAQLLTFTSVRLGSGIALQVAPADLRALCESVIAELALRASSQPSCEFIGDLHGTWDADRLMEVISNIAGNAIEHAAPGTPIRVRAWPEGAGTQVAVEISNQGACIPVDVLPYIFLAFHQGRQSKHSKVGNVGLGLYIAKNIVLGHGGTLDVESANETTAFTLRLPRVSMPQSPAAI